MFVISITSIVSCFQDKWKPAPIQLGRYTPKYSESFGKTCSFRIIAFFYRLDCGYGPRSSPLTYSKITVHTLPENVARMFISRRIEKTRVVSRIPSKLFSLKREARGFFLRHLLFIRTVFWTYGIKASSKSECSFQLQHKICE